MDGSAYRGMGEAIMALFYAFVAVLAVTVPLAIWKLIDIGIWIFHHVHVAWK